MVSAANASVGTEMRRGGATAAGTIRPAAREDLGAVARLFHKTFKHNASGSLSLETYLDELLFAHPWRDPELRSLVHVAADGTVNGFVAILPLPLLLDGVPIRAAVGSTLMVDQPARNPLAGARLMRAFLGGTQDISISESANEVSQRMWERAGGRTIAPYSMEWLRVLRPAGFGLAVAERTTNAAKLLRPAAGGIDALVGRMKSNSLRLPSTVPSGADVGSDELMELIVRFSSSYALHPAFDREGLAFLLAHAAVKERHGNLFRRAVFGRGGAPIGAYLYYARPKGIAFVLQILAAPPAAETVVDDLLAHAHSVGAVALRGRVQPELADLLLRRRAVFLHASSTVVHTRREDLLSPIRSGDALITGLAGEAWSRLIGGSFRRQG